MSYLHWLYLSSIHCSGTSVLLHWIDRFVDLTRGNVSKPIRYEKKNQLCHCIVRVVVLLIDLFFTPLSLQLHIYHLCKVIQKQQQIFEKKVGHLMLTKTKPVYCDNLMARNGTGLSGCNYILQIIFCISMNHFTWQYTLQKYQFLVLSRFTC